MKTIFIFLMSLILVSGMQAQNKIEGYYNQAKKTFLPKENLTSAREIYEVEDFKFGYGIISLRDSTDCTGVIDSTGKICVPLRYNSVDFFTGSAPFYVLFRSGDSLGIADLKGAEHFRLYAPVIRINYDFNGDNEAARNDKMARENEILSTRNPTLAIVKYNQKMGLYSLTEHKYIIKPEFDFTPHYDWPCEICSSGSDDLDLDEKNTAWGKQNGKYRAVNIQTCEKSEPYLEFVPLSTGSFYIRKITGERLISADAVRPVNTSAYTIEEYFNDKFIISINGKFGLMNAAGAITIPAVYNDIYFANDKCVWVKQDGYWALFTNENESKTPFDFFDIDKSNEQYWENYIYFTRLDTSYKKLYSDSYVSFSDRTNRVKSFARKIKTVLGTRKLYTIFGLRYDIERKNDGYHVIYLPLFKEEPEAWEMVYMVPQIVDGVNNVFGYKKSGKYGVSEKDVRYEAIIYDTKKLSYYSDRGCIVKGKYIYTNAIIYSGSKNVGERWEKASLYAEYIIE